LKLVLVRSRVKVRKEESVGDAILSFEVSHLFSLLKQNVTTIDSDDGVVLIADLSRNHVQRDSVFSADLCDVRCFAERVPFFRTVYMSKAKKLPQRTLVRVNRNWQVIQCASRLGRYFWEISRLESAP
jgi:hypothetical protein